MGDLWDCDDAGELFYGYCLKASMTGWDGWSCLVVGPALWIPAYAGMTVEVVLNGGIVSPRCGLRIKSAMTVLVAPCPVDTALKPV